MPWLLVLLGLPLVLLSGRLALQAVRGRHAPEGWLAAFFALLLVEMALYPLAQFGWLAVESVPVWRLVVVPASGFSLMAFTARVFRPRQRSAWLAAAVVSAGMVLTCWLGQQAAHAAVAGLVFSVLRFSAFVWTSLECAAEARAGARRAALGLGDPTIANRFLLWSCWTAGLAALPSIGIVLRLRELLAPQPVASLVDGTVVLNAFTVALASFAFSTVTVAVVACWLSFFPPNRYLALVRARACSAARVASQA